MPARTITPPSNAISAEQFQAHYRAIKDAQRRKEEAAAAFKAARDRAKSDGIDMNSLKMAEHLMGLDHNSAELRWLETERYANWLGMPVGSQLDMFGQHGETINLTDRIAGVHREWAAEQEGYGAAKAGRPSDTNPHSPGSPFYERWGKGWRDFKAHEAEIKPEEGDEAESE